MNTKFSRIVKALPLNEIDLEIRRINKLNVKSQWSVLTNSNDKKKAQSWIELDYKFKNFRSTWAFLNKVADHADQVKHHPTIETTYNHINIKLTTHDQQNNITEKDIEFAGFIQENI